MNSDFQNVVVHILRLFAYVYDCQMMPSKFKLTMYYDTSYTSPFLVKISSPIVCFDLFFFHYFAFMDCGIK
jgi:hypothetical protein